jgi:hypothetical protein
MVRTALALGSAAFLCASPAPAQRADSAPARAYKTAASARPAGSITFCLFELPGNSSDTRRLINLVGVQYMELSGDQLRIFYGGGNLGAGYEARIGLKSREEGQDVIARMQKAAQECK